MEQESWQWALDEMAARQARIDAMHQTTMEQVADAREALDLDDDRILRVPWPSVDRLIGGISPHHMTMVCAFSGMGKTTFLMSLTDAWFREGRKVYYMGLESVPMELRTIWACFQLGIHAGWILSYNYRKDAENWREIRDIVRREIARQEEPPYVDLIHFSGEEFIDLGKVRDAYAEAADWGADVIIIDHIDHIAVDNERRGGDLWSQSVAVSKGILSLAKEYRIPPFIASQLNNEAVSDSPLSAYLPPQPHMVQMGGHKRQVMHYQLGLWKPLRFSGPSVEELKLVQARRAPPSTVLEPNVMGVLKMKNRILGDDGERAFLRVENGRCTDMHQPILQSPRDL